MVMSTEDLQGTHNGTQPENVPQLPPAVSPPEPQPVVVGELHDAAVESAYANTPMRLGLVERYDDLYEGPAEDNLSVEVDGMAVGVTGMDLTWDDKLPTHVSKALKAAGFDVLGVLAAADGSGPRAFTLESFGPEAGTSE
jgi:hypothetical protein